MKSVTVNLKMAGDVKDFVNIVAKYPYTVDLRSGRYVVDAKSLLGIFSLDLSKPITLEIFDDKCEDLLGELSRFVD